MDRTTALDQVLDSIYRGELEPGERTRLINALNSQVKQERQQRKAEALDALQGDTIYITYGLRKGNGYRCRIKRVLKTRAEVEFIGSNPWSHCSVVRIPLACLKPVTD